MNVTHMQTSGWNAAFYGMRNPMNSWVKSDSFFGVFAEDNNLINEVANDYAYKNNDIDGDDPHFDTEYERLVDEYEIWLGLNCYINIGKYANEIALIGPDDMALAQKLIKGGTEHSKFLRQIFVSMDITAPLYWWKEMDTYKVGTVANSTSTMHKLASTPITKECFEMGDFEKNLMFYEKEPYMPDINADEFWDMFINDLENLRKKYLKTNDIRYWKELIRLLPESWLQTRTWSANYAILRNIYSQRKNHKLTEWHFFCDKIQSLPYARELITIGLD